MNENQYLVIVVDDELSIAWFQIVSNYMHREIRLTSKELLLNGLEEFPLTVNFSPSTVGCIDAIIRIRLVGTATRHSVSSKTV